MWENEKMLVTSIFSIPENVFYSIRDRNCNLSFIQFVIFNHTQFYHVITLSKTNPCFLHVRSTSFLKTLLEKEKFLFTHTIFCFLQCFLPFCGNFLSISSHLKSSTANSFNLDESKICCLVKS